PLGATAPPPAGSGWPGRRTQGRPTVGPTGGGRQPTRRRLSTADPRDDGGPQRGARDRPGPVGAPRSGWWRPDAAVPAAVRRLREGHIAACRRRAPATLAGVGRQTARRPATATNGTYARV